MDENLKTNSGMHIAALVLGIISIVTNLFYYMALPTGILAIVFGIKSARRTGSKIGKAGMITGIVGVSLTVFIYVSMIMILFLADNF